MSSDMKMVYPNGSMQEMVWRLLDTTRVFLEGYSGGGPICVTDLDLGSVRISNLDLFRSQDIPVLLEKGIYDLGIVGQDWVMERQADVTEVVNFALSRQSFRTIKIVLAVPKKSAWQSVTDFPSNFVIATEYPIIASRYFRSKGRNDVAIFRTNGQTEQMPGIGAADGIVDITETGGSLERNNLRILDQIAESRMTLSANRSAFDDPEKGPAIRKFGEMILDCYRLMLLEENRGAKT